MDDAKQPNISDLQQALAGGDLSGLLAQAQALQAQLADAQNAAAEQVVEGQSGGGAVKISVSGGMEFRSVHIDRSVIDEVEMLEDLVLAALHDAVAKVNQLNESTTSSIFGG